MLQVAGHPIGAVAGAVGPPRHHPQLAAHGPFGLPRFDPGTLLRRLKAVFSGIRLPVAEVEADAHRRLGGLARLEHGAVDQIRQTICAHPPAGGQAEAEQDAIKNVALARAIRSRHHGEPLLEGDRHRPTERLELRQPDLIDVNQQERGLSAS